VTATQGNLPFAASLTSRPPAPLDMTAGLSQAKAQRFERIVAEHFAAMWRFLRRLGLPEADTDDAAQEVLLVVVAKLDRIEPHSERPFLFSTAFRVAAAIRRGQRRHLELDEDILPIAADADANPEELLELKRARVLLDRLLSPMPLELRAVFVLYELEGLTMAEIASALELAPGTVASRLRRGREFFNARFARAKARQAGTGGVR
jgi:RNA polymerase sigma-70 factor (ECF subfamily)